MNLAYCVSAYTDPEQLLRLVKSIPSGTFFIHIDKNRILRDFKEILKHESKRIHFIESIKIRWATISQVEYQMRLMETVLQSPIRFDYIFMLSGFDYPLWSCGRINDFLEENKGLEFIQGIECQTTYYLCDLYREIRPDIDIPFLGNGINRILRGGSRLICKLFRIRKPKYINSGNGKLSVYRGSDYFCITSQLAQYLIDTYRKDPAIKKYFRNTFAPSESVVHTIAFNSHFKEKCILTKGPYAGLQSLTPLHYIDGCHIKILDKEDYMKLISSGKMFGRKFRSGKSEGLIEMLEEYRRK